MTHYSPILLPFTDLSTTTTSHSLCSGQNGLSRELDYCLLTSDAGMYVSGHRLIIYYRSWQNREFLHDIKSIYHIQPVTFSLFNYVQESFDPDVRNLSTVSNLNLTSFSFHVITLCTFHPAWPQRAPLTFLSVIIICDKSSVSCYNSETKEQFSAKESTVFNS